MGHGAAFVEGRGKEQAVFQGWKMCLGAEGHLWILVVLGLPVGFAAVQRIGAEPLAVPSSKYQKLLQNQAACWWR